jgi:hypothetical protein
MDTPRYMIVQAGFVLLTLLFISLLVFEFRKAIRLTGWDQKQTSSFLNRIIGALLIWGAFVSAWSLSGKMADFSMFPLNFLPVIAIPIIVALVFIPSKKLGEVLRHIPPANLIRLQSFRLFVEVLLWMLFIDSVLPVQMTFEGRNFDILSGLSAPVIAILVSKGKISRTGVVIWNIICLGLLLNIVITAILSTPSPWRVFMNEPANYIVTYFPISWLPGFLVPLAYYLHFMSLRQMGQKQ